MKHIDVSRFSRILRARSVSVNDKKVLIAKIADSSQANDLTVPANCNGFGRIRHFKQHKHEDWSPDPLPNLPAFKFFGLPPTDELRAQVFQLSSCNYRCWYCFVDSSRLSANPKYSRFFSCDELLDLYLSQDAPPLVIDLSGGQPDIVPEWGLWMMRAIERKNLFGKVYLWSDDNLSNDYFWKYLSKSDISYMTSFNGYGRVGCFKGYDEDSFSFNTYALPHEFERQFIFFNKLLLNGFDMYAYVTFTSFQVNDLSSRIDKFVERLIRIHPKLPLRVVPLKIERFSPTANRLQPKYQQALRFQYDVHNAWLERLTREYSQEELNKDITDVDIANGVDR